MGEKRARTSEKTVGAPCRWTFGTAADKRIHGGGDMFGEFWEGLNIMKFSKEKSKKRNRSFSNHVKTYAKYLRINSGSSDEKGFK